MNKALAEKIVQRQPEAQSYKALVEHTRRVQARSEDTEHKRLEGHAEHTDRVTKEVSNANNALTKYVDECLGNLKSKCDVVHAEFLHGLDEAEGSMVRASMMTPSGPSRKMVYLKVGARHEGQKDTGAKPVSKGDTN